MKVAKQWRLTAAVLAAIAFGGCTGPVGYDDTDRKVDSLLKQMTLDEKIGQMSQFSCNWDVTGAIMPDDYREYLRKGMVGSILNGYTVAGIRLLQSEALEHSRLKIPVLFGYDVVHGYRTIFPIPLGESCTWDLELMRRSAAIAAEEAAAGGINWTFAPMVDITRDPRWGRVMEGAGEDPYLGSLIARARVEGFQGGDLGSTKTVLACTKHFAAYGAAEAGRDYNTTDMSEHTLREVYLPPFRATAEAGVGSLMASFNEIGGIPATANRHLMTDILRGEWGFGGILVSDYTGINELVPHGIAADEKEAGEKALNAGIDMDMTGAVYMKYLRRSLDEGRVSLRQIDDAVRRILRQKFLLGLFDDPYRYLDSLRERETLGKPEFRAKAREIAARSIVLLKNDGILPLDKDKLRAIAVIGPNADSQEVLKGNYNGTASEYVTILEGIHRICDGKGEDGDIERLENLAQNIKATALCGLGQTAPNPVLSTLHHFRDEYIAHVVEKRCPAGVCKKLVRSSIQPDACIGCGKCAKNCPVDAITRTDYIAPGHKLASMQIDTKKCVKCGACISNCKFNAITKA